MFTFYREYKNNDKINGNPPCRGWQLGRHASALFRHGRAVLATRREVCFVHELAFVRDVETIESLRLTTSTAAATRYVVIELISP